MCCPAINIPLAKNNDPIIVTKKPFFIQEIPFDLSAKKPIEKQAIGLR